MTDVQDEWAGAAGPVLTVIQSDALVGLDRFAEWLDLPVRLVRADLGELLPAPDEVGAGLLVLGGRMSVLAADEAPWLPQLRALIGAVSCAGVPTLGICLGAQLLALARGGRVQVAAPPGPERGVVDVRWRPEADADPLVGGLAAGRTSPVPQWHDDAVVDLPAGAVWLASSATYPYQAFRIGSAWGVQFHPEASAASLVEWAVEHDEMDELELFGAVSARADELTALGSGLALRFAALVRAHADSSSPAPARP